MAAEAAPHDIVSLTILRQATSLLVSLSDSRSLARMGAVPFEDPFVEDLMREHESVLATCADHGSGQVSSSAASAAVRALGARIFASLLPEAICRFLRQTGPRALSLQLDPGLCWIPWELAFDGERFLGEVHVVLRHAVNDESRPPARLAGPGVGPLDILVLAGAARRIADVSEPARLLRGLHQTEGIHVIAAAAEEFTDESLIELIGRSKVVHYVGPLDELPPPVNRAAGHVREFLPKATVVAALALPPAAYVLQSTSKQDLSTSAVSRQLACEIAQAGIAVLTCRSESDREDVTEFVATIYRGLARGASLGESARRARATLHQRFGLATLVRMDVALYGEDRSAIPSRDVQLQVEDTLRQVTIMSFDLVDSTRLLGELGAERYSEVLGEYHRRCEQIIRGCGGAPDAPQGDDGITCYFGFPTAREDAAQQAVRAALEIVPAVRALKLDVRIGISTGEVVVRDGQPVGKPIHFAARLQSIAEPGTVVIGDSTRRLIKDRFRVEPRLDVPQLRGFDHHEHVFRVVRPTWALDSEQSAAPDLHFFVGRQSELLTLRQHWLAARTGSLRAVRLVGDAGIGKSRLLREFKYELASEGQMVFECRCAPDHAHSAFQPVVDWLRRELQILPNDEPGAALQKLAEFVGHVAIEGADALIADLLSLADPPSHPVLAQPPARRRQLTLDALVGLTRARLERGPACMMFEDIHWLDPSTQEFLDQLVARTSELPLLFISTARPEGSGVWRPRVELHELELRGLAQEASRRLIRSASGAARLPSEAVHLLAARSDGVPLFIEESTRMVVESHARQSDAVYAATLAVPTTLLDLLNARLDRLGDAKQVAQIGATIGREFPLRLLKSVLGHESSPFVSSDLQARLGTLVASGMLLRLGEGDEARYLFKHELMRDAASRSLLERDRRRLHRVVALVVTSRFEALAKAQPELLAFHFTEAGEHAEAFKYWELAARQAIARSAHVEAINHLGSGLAVLAHMPHGSERDRAELRLQLMLAARLIATDGYGASRVERAYLRARNLAQKLGDGASLMKILLGLEGYHFMRADFINAHAIALDVGARAVDGSDPMQRIQSRWAVANILAHQGRLQQAVREMDECRAEYDRIEHRRGAVQNPAVMCLCYSSWSLWLLGFPDEAQRRSVRVVELSTELEHNFSLAQAHGFRASIQYFRGEDEAALRSAERSIAICEENGFLVWLAHARLMRGRAVAELGDPAAGIDEMRQAYELWSGTGAVVTTPFHLALRAETLVEMGRADEGLELLAEALETIERCGERYYEPEVLRLHGTLTAKAALQARRDRDADVEAWLLRARASAQSLDAHSLGLRCAMDLAELWAARDRRTEAIGLLESSRAAVTGGDGTRDVVRAQRLLADVTRTSMASQ
jgi:class 3 adenylate cyclase/tetratricopeptide (TPR) repeat protein